MYKMYKNLRTFRFVLGHLGQILACLDLFGPLWACLELNLKPPLSLQIMEYEVCPDCPPPVFNLPPPPRPPDLPCPDQNQARPLIQSPNGLEVDWQESCDINYVIDSRLYLGENLFTLLIILLCSCILVCIIMTIAILVYR